MRNVNLNQVSRRRMANPLLKGQSTETVKMALELAAENGVGVEGVSHQAFVVSEQHPFGRSTWATLIKQGHLSSTDVVWAWVPQGRSRGRNGKVREHRGYLAVRIDVSKITGNPEHVFFINLNAETKEERERNRSLLTRMGERAIIRIKEEQFRVARLEKELMERHNHVRSEFLPEIIE